MFRFSCPRSWSDRDPQNGRHSAPSVLHVSMIVVAGEIIGGVDVCSYHRWLVVELQVSQFRFLQFSVTSLGLGPRKTERRRRRQVAGSMKKGQPFTI